MADSGVAELVERLLTEGPMSLSELARLHGVSQKEGKSLHPATLMRWATKGITLAGGEVVVLESMMMAGKRVTSRAALVRFLVATQPGTQGRHPHFRKSPRTKTPYKRSQRASDALDALGVGCPPPAYADAS